MDSRRRNKMVYFDGLVQADTTPTAPDWLSGLRASASARTATLTLPDSRNEDWRFTDIGPLRKLSFQYAVGAARALTPDDIAAFVLPEAASRLVFVDGVYAPRLSSLAGLPEGVTLARLADAAGNRPLIEAHLGRYAPFDQDAFPALNTSLLHDGALVAVAKGVHCVQPIHLLFVASASDVPLSVHPRCLVVAERDSECLVIEDYVCLDDTVYFTNPVTEIAVQDNARARHVKLQRDSRKAFHIANTAVHLGPAAHYESHTVTLGARISRHDLSVLQTADGAECTLDGLTLIGGRQLADTHTAIDHAKPHGKSRQFNKCIVDGGAHAVFNGKILVRKDAQQTDSAQSSRNLLLSDKAHIDTKPQLEIFADDVKCAHGATVGQLDSDELFYLKSRGLNESVARSLLIYAFAAELIAKLPLTSIRKRLERAVMEQMHIESIGNTP